MIKLFHNGIFTRFEFVDMFSFDVKGGKDDNPPNMATIFFETCKKDNKLVKPEAIENMCIW